MDGRVDLHLHTTASDGRLRPGEMVRLAARLGLKVIAITDHDSVEGITEALNAAREFPSLTVVPGVEMSTDVPRSEIHILGYFIEYQDREFNLMLESLRNSRVVRAQRMVQKLDGLGVHIEWSRVAELAGDASVGRPHVAQAMLEKGHVSSLKEAFDRYLGRNGPAYVEREKLTPTEVVQLISSVRGLPVLAHPGSLTDGLDSLLDELQKAGLVGMEVYYSDYTPDTVSHLAAVARKHGLLACGGSDYHAMDSAEETPPGGSHVPLAAAEALIAMARKRGRLTSDA
ncbi:MAG: PHP domain-containing protein [Dehalococcoidia bacterium]|nr:PHP domain-containing protein [Dehalococcoidia bacterium]